MAIEPTRDVMEFQCNKIQLVPIFFLAMNISKNVKNPYDLAGGFCYSEYDLFFLSSDLAG